MNRFKPFFFFSLLLTSALCAEIINPYPEREKHSLRYSKAPVLDEICGILLIPNQDYVDHVCTSGVHGLETWDVQVPGSLCALAECLEPYFMGEALTSDLLDFLKEQIVLYWREQGHPVVSVYVPEQEITHGVLQLVVMEGHVGHIAVSQNCWFPDWLFEAGMWIGPGDEITTYRLLTDLSWLNRNPFRTVDVVFTPGCDPCYTNIELVVCDRCPLQVYVGADNAGTANSSTGRLFGGITWGNAFWLDQILTYQYTCSPDAKEFQSHTGHWTIPLPWHNLILAYGGYSVVKPDIRDFDSKGTASQSSIRYVIPFGCNYNGRLQEFSLGFDFKNFNNNLIFTSEEAFAVITNTVNLSQFTAGYAFGFETACQSFTFNLDLYGSPGKLLPNESDERYQELTPHAQVKYIYGRLTVGDIFTLLWDWTFSTLGRLQLASQPLLPSERFGIGGYDTVRGYEERILNVDDALVLNAELRTPPLSVLQFFTGCCDEDYLVFLAFFDYGLGALNNRNLGADFATIGDKLPKTEYLMSTGVGVRYTINRYLAARLDWGAKLHRDIFSDRSRSRWHGGIVLSF